MSRRAFITLLFISVLLYQAVSLYKIITTMAPDFSVFYQSAQNLLAGKNLYTDQTLYTGLGYPPFTLLLFFPLTIFPYQLAQGILIVASLVALLFSIILSLRLAKTYTTNRFFLATALCFLAFPTKFTFGMGQVNIVALFLLLVALQKVKEGREGLGGVFWGLLLILKPHFILLLPIFFLKKKWEMAAVAMCLVLLATIVSGLWFGWGQYITYFNRTVPELLVFRGREIYYNQGLGAFFSRAQPLGLASVETSVISLLLLIGSYWLVYKKKIPLLPAIILFLPIFLLVEPLSWQHHYVFLLPTYIYLWEKLKGDNRRLGILGVSYLLVGVNIKQPEIFSGTLGGGIFLSHVFWGNLILIFLSYGILSRRHLFS